MGRRFIRLSSGERVRVEARFSNLDEVRFLEFCGRVATVEGSSTRRTREVVIKSVTGVSP